MKRAASLCRGAACFVGHACFVGSFAEDASDLALDFFKYALFHSVAVEVADEARAFHLLYDLAHREIAGVDTLQVFRHLCDVEISSELRGQFRDNALYVHNS